MRGFVLLILGSLFVLAYLLKPPPLEKVALRIEDTKFGVRNYLRAYPKLSENVLVVAIDEKSINELGRWPWSRYVLAELVENLKEAKVVALDIVFSEPENPQVDKLLADSIKRNGNVILGFFLRLSSTQKEDPEALALLEESEFLRYKLMTDRVGLLEIPYVELNLKPFMESALASGYLNAEPDVDALYRKYTIAHLFRGGIYLPLALQAVRFYTGEDFQMVLSSHGIEELRFRGKKIPVYEGRFHRINFYPLKDVKLISAVDVVKRRVSPEIFKDKVVFVGATEIGIYDVRPTPLNPVTPGVYLHAFTFSNFEKFHFIRKSVISDLLIIAVLTGLPYFISLLRSFSKRTLFYSCVLIFYIFISYSSFAFLNLDFNLFYPLLAFTASVIFQEGFKVLIAEKDIRELRRAFSSYVSPQLLEIISRNPEKLKLGGEKRKLTVLFSDIRGFTSLSEKLDPEDLVNLLNEFLTPMTEIILNKGGMLDKYIGDAIMALFNVPVDVENHADRACASALEMIKTLEKLNPTFRKKYGIVVDIGIGINTGEAVVGNMGSKQRFDYTAIGDTVNLASRLEGLNKVYRTKIIISEYTKKELREDFLLRKLDLVVVKGKTKPVIIYELLENTEENRKKAKEFESALDQYISGFFENAYILFSELSIKYGDEPSRVFAGRCREMIEKPPSEWNGVYISREK